MANLIKTLESAKIKDSILDILRSAPMTFAELYALYPDINRTRFSGYMAALRKMGLVDLSPLSRKYSCISDRTYTEVIKEVLDRNIQLRTNSAKQKAKDFTPSPYGKVYRMEDHKARSKGNKQKINPWIGYTSFTETY